MPESLSRGITVIGLMACAIVAGYLGQDGLSFLCTLGAILVALG